MSRYISAIDIGSNAIRMIVGEFDGSRVEIARKFRAPVRLGKDVFKDGKIAEDTLKAAEKAFRRFAAVNRKYKVLACRAVATSAVREAKNKEDFVRRMGDRSKIRVDVIDGIEEARLIHAAVRREVDFAKRRIMLLDIGGGSVEITFSEGGAMSATRSFPMGTVRMLQELDRRKLDERGLKVVLGEFMQPLSRYIESNVTAMPVELAVGTGGNLECMGRLKVRLLHKTPNTFVSLSELGEICRILESTSAKDRIEKLDLRHDRADVIVPATLLVKMIMRQAGIEKILIPGVGLRDGLLWSLAEKVKITAP